MDPTRPLRHETCAGAGAEAGSSKVQIAVVVDVDLDVFADLPAPEPLGIRVPDPVYKRDRVILDLHTHLLGLSIDDLRDFEEIEALLERTEVRGVEGVEELKRLTCTRDILKRGFLDGADVCL